MSNFKFRPSLQSLDDRIVPDAVVPEVPLAESGQRYTPPTTDASVRTLELRPSDLADGGIRTLEIGPGYQGDSGVTNMFLPAAVVVAAPALAEVVVAAGVGVTTGEIAAVGTAIVVTGSGYIFATRAGVPFRGASTIDAQDRNEMSRLFWDWVFNSTDPPPGSTVPEEGAGDYARGGDGGGSSFAPDEATAPSPTPATGGATAGASGSSKPPEQPPVNVAPAPDGDGVPPDSPSPSGLPKDLHDLAIEALNGTKTRAELLARTTPEQRQQLSDFFLKTAARESTRRQPAASEFDTYRAAWIAGYVAPAPGNLGQFRLNILPRMTTDPLK